MIVDLSKTEMVLRCLSHNGKLSVWLTLSRVCGTESAINGVYVHELVTNFVRNVA